MVIQWGCLAKCQGTRKGGLEFRRRRPCLVVIRAKISRLQHFVRFANVEERTFRDNTNEFSKKFLENRIHQQRYQTRNKKR